MLLINLNTTRDVIRILFSWKYHAFAVFSIVVGVVMSYAYFCTPTYTSAASILVLPKAGAGIIVTTGPTPGTISPVTPQEINTEMELLTSNDVLRQTVRSFMDQGTNPGLEATKANPSFIDRALKKAKDKLKEALIVTGLLPPNAGYFEYLVWLLGESITVEVLPMTNMFVAELEAERPKAVKIVLDRLLEVYIRHHDLAYSNVEGADLFTSISQKIKRELAETEKKIQVLKKQMHVVDIDSQRQENIALQSQLSLELNHMNIAVTEMEDRINLFKTILENNQDEIIISKTMRNIPTIIELEKTIVPILVLKSDIEKRFSKTSSKYLNVISQLNSLQNNLRTEVKKVLKADTIELEAKIRKRENLKREITKLRQEGISLNEQSSQLQELLRLKAHQIQNLNLYDAKLSEIEIAKERLDKRLAKVRIVDYPNFPAKRSWPNRLILLIISVVIGICAALCAPMLLEFVDLRVKTVADIENSLKLEVLAVYPDKIEKKSGKILL